ncbi:MAG: aldehyde dehydrogenase (NADP(+)) [Opitutales bacterium]|nr:aldehyde dehydrogenase (NADP(+)) [Opitutales bacterium]
MVNESFPDASEDQVDSALRAAEAAFPVYRKLPGDRRARFLESIANGLERGAKEIIDLANNETSLDLPRLKIELRRTAGQARFFADLARSGEWRETRVDEAEPERHPIPKPALRSQNIPLGPVVVIGACNFPLAISVVGTDTVSALAVGCPVVVKSHPGHPATCEKLGALVAEAAKATGIPDGAFSLLHGESHRVGRELVEHPMAKAVAFTGSLHGGKALAALAAERPEPIPFYAEMGSLNPLFVLPGALRERADEIAQGYVAAVTLFAGQMCTKPGILVATEGPEFDAFLATAAEVTRRHPPVAMLNTEVRDNFEAGMEVLGEKAERVAISEQCPTPSRNEGVCQLFAADVSAFLVDPTLQAEAFGPASIILRSTNETELIELAKRVEGTLTASMHVGTGDSALVDQLLPILERKAGRVLWNGFPPGVVPSPSTHHGGPWPATTDARHTSIGLFGYRRFVRPVCLQGFPS